MSSSLNKPILADDATERISLLLKLRLPWLLIGLVFGILVTLFIGQFESLLNKHVEVAFFIPLIVYLSDAVGTQTETIFVRNLVGKKANFLKYLFKELFIGVILGLIFAVLTGIFALLWIKITAIAFTIALAMFFSVSTATILGLVIPFLFYEEHTDPAVGAGPMKTVIQDFVSIGIYLLIASLLIL